MSRVGIGLLLVILATASWSTSGIFISWVAQGGGLTPVGLAFWRDLATFTSLLIGILVLRPGLVKVASRDLPWLAAMGAISIGLFHVLWNTNILMNGASVATVIQNNAPIFVTFVAWLIWKEPLTSRKILAIALAVLGTVLISKLGRMDGTGAGNTLTLTGLLVGLASAMAYGTFTLFGKKLSGSYNPWTILLYVFGFGTLTLLPFQIGLRPPWPVETAVILNFAGLVLVTTIFGFGFYTYALQRLQASVASITATAEVPFAAILAFILLHERLDGLQILGAMLVICGVILLSLPKKESGATLPEPGPELSSPILSSQTERDKINP
jgi:drug/metabolite transporter, DME family